VIGIGMGSGLYEAAFAALVRLYGHHSRGAITGVTLFAGFASTVGWPLAALLEAHVGWRGACFAWAGLHVLVGLPLNWSIPQATPSAGLVLHSACTAETPDTQRTGTARASMLLGIVFAFT
jgi:predicted MFS family arabinose efflux permease